MRIVGWGVMEGDEFCACGGEATAYAVKNSLYEDMIPVCSRCVPEGTVDGVGEVFASVFAGKGEC